MAKNKLPTDKKPIPVTVVSNSTVSNALPMKMDKDDTRERKWKAEDALRVLQDAENYRKDKSLMSDVKKLAKEKVNCLKRIK